MNGDSDFRPPAPGGEFPPPTVTTTFAPHEAISVVAHEAPKKRRTGLFAAVGVLAAVAIGAGTFALLSSDDEAEAFSLDTAVAAAAAAESVEYTITVNTMGEEIVMETAIDNASGLGRISMQIGGLFDDGIEMIIDTKNEVVYVSSDLFKSIGLDVEAKWLRMDQKFIAESGSDSPFTKAISNEALVADELVANAKSVEDLGVEEIDGEQLKHYRVTVDAAAASETSPQLSEQFAEFDGVMPDEIVYDMWVTSDNVLRRLSLDLDIGPATVSTLIVIRPSTEPIDIVLPTGDDVIDAGDLL